MITFEVNDMTCGHCVSTITKAVKSLDKDAKIDIDLASHHVQIQSSTADADGLRRAIQEAGYTPVAVEPSAKVPTSSAASARGGCCCR